jgi:hypothetical protein
MTQTGIITDTAISEIRIFKESDLSPCTPNITPQTTPPIIPDHNPTMKETCSLVAVGGNNRLITAAEVNVSNGGNSRGRRSHIRDNFLTEISSAANKTLPQCGQETAPDFSEISLWQRGQVIAELTPHLIEIQC